jgi:nucleoside-diphosphate-sugar epimerase
MACHRRQGVDTAIMRIFNTYGPRMRPNDGRAIPTFLRQALQDRPITVFGDGSQTRSFCFVSDLIAGMVALAESGCHDPVNVAVEGAQGRADAQAARRRAHPDRGDARRDRTGGYFGSHPRRQRHQPRR